MRVHSFSPQPASSLGVDFDEGRFRPITFKVAECPLAEIVIWLAMGESAFARQIVFAEAVFAPLYVTTSTVNADGDEHVFSVLPLGGWTDSPVMRVGQFTEATYELDV